MRDNQEIEMSEAAKESEQARELITMSVRDFQIFKMAMNGEFAPNPALQKALSAVQKVKVAGVGSSSK